MRGTYKRGGGGEDLDLWREFTVMPGNREDNTQANLKSYLLEERKVEKSYVTLGKASTGNYRATLSQATTTIWHTDLKLSWNRTEEGQ